MRGQISLNNPEAAFVTLTLTMQLAEWRAIRKELSDKHPAWQLSSLIDSLVSHATRHFTEEVDRVP